MTDDFIRDRFPNYPSEDQAARFFGALGRALAEWQVVEMYLYRIYEMAIRPTHMGACGVAFHRIQTFSLKLSVADGAISAVLADSALLGAWGVLHDSIQNKTKVRNKLAHFAVYTKFDEPQPGERIRMEPGIFSFQALLGREERLRENDVHQALGSFERLGGKLMRFRHDLSAELGLTPKSA